MKHREELRIDMGVLGLTYNRAQPALMSRAHRHNEVELNLIEEGAITYLFGGVRIEVQVGQLAFFWAAIPHQLIDVEEPTTYHCLTVPFSSFLQWSLPEIVVQQIVCGKCVLEDVQQPVTLVLFKQWHNDLQENTAERHKIVLLETEACLRRLALAMEKRARENGEVMKGEVKGRIPVHAMSKVERMAVFISLHYMESLHIEDIATSVFLHPNYAMGLFRKHFGISVMEYVTQYRIAHAQRLLITTEMNVSEIALDAGFGSVSRFYSIFKEACGQLPGDYRRDLYLQQ